VKQDQDSELGKAIRAKATRFEAPAALRGRIGAALTDADPASTAPRRSLFWTLRQSQWLGMGAAFACGVIASVAVSLFYAASNDEDRLSREILAGHVRSLMVAHLADVDSSDQHTVKPWFNGKLDFSPPVHDLASEGFPLVGGRLDYLNQRPVAALVYRRQQHTINLFVWPSGGSSPKEVKLVSRQGFHVADWSDSDMQYWAVSDLNPAEMREFANLLRRAIKE
jgi:anti-sigma factor RsiW